LVLEGAEDLDLLGPGKAETIQTKDTKASGTVTLNSDDIIDAVDHFWQHQERNQDRTVYLYYLTTAERGTEKDPAFSIGRGLDYWDKARRPEVTLSPLREFFRDHKKLSEIVRQFIVESSDEIVRERLIRRITWDTGAEPKEFIEKLVEESVCYYGSTMSLQPSESRKVVPHLLKRAWDTACNPKETDRILRRIDFMEVFEEATTERVPRRELDALRAPIVRTFLGLLPKEHVSTIYAPDFPPRSGASPLPDRASRRKKLVSQLSPVLRQSGQLIVHGSTGMGKSTIAKLVTENIAEAWVWLQLRGLGPEESSRMLYSVLATGLPTGNLVIEDIDLSKSDVETAFAAAIYALGQENTSIIATTSTDPGFKTRALMRDESSIVGTPSFSDEEAQEVLDNHGCPADLTKGLALFLLATTRGHPQLLHAEIRRLERQGWPKLTADDLLPSKDVGDVRQLARKQLVESLPSDAARTLAYRLSIFSGPFTRDQAIRMGEKAPSLERPGELFDLLIGPWVERLGTDYFRISPLLLGSAAEVWSGGEIKALYSTAAKALTAKSSITSTEASNALLFAVLCEADSVVSGLTASLLTSAKTALPQMADAFLWMIFWKTEIGTPIYPSNAFLNIMLRHLQFAIAAESDHASIAAKVAEVWEQEIENIQELEVKKLSRFLFLATTILRDDVEFPVQVLLHRIQEIECLSKELGVQTPDFTEAGGGGLVLVDVLFLTTVRRCQGIDALRQLLTVLEQQPPEYRARLLSVFVKEPMWATILMNQAWLHEAESQSPRWEDCMEVYNHSISVATDWRVMPLVEEAFHAMMVIEDEYRDLPQQALAIAERAEHLVGRDSKIIRNAKAMVLYRKHSYKEAIREWCGVLPEWKGMGVPITSFTCAIKSAATMGEWEKAEECASLGETAAKESGMHTVSLGFRIDLGFVLWKAGARKRAVETFGLVLDEFPNLPAAETNVESYLLQKRVGYAITWFLNDYEQNHKEDHPEPPPGSFSDLHLSENEYRIGLKDYPVQPDVVSWYLLADLDTRAGLRTDIFEKFSVKVDKTKLHSLKFQRDHLRILRALSDLDVKSIIGHFERFFQSLATAKPFIEKKMGPFFEVEDTVGSVQVNRDELIESFLWLFVAAVILTVLRGRNLSETVSVWHEELEEHRDYLERVDDLLSLMKDGEKMTLSELVMIVGNGDAASEKRVVAAALVSTQEGLDPGDRLYANIVLFNFVFSSIWRDSLKEELATTISHGWLTTVKNQSFALASPLSTGPTIVQACTGPDRGIKKAAKILLAARGAVRLRLPDYTFDQLLKAAAGADA
jgi:hypothetical protein